MISDTIRDQIDEAFEFISYVNRYAKHGIKFDLGGSDRVNFSVSYRQDGSPRVTDLNKKKETVESHLLEPFYNMRWKERSVLFTEFDFIENELSFLSKFSDVIKTDYEYTIHPLIKMFKEKKEQLLKKAMDPVKKELEIKQVKEITTGYLADLDIDKYITWCLTKKAKNRQQKKDTAMQLVEFRGGKTMANYRFAINEIFYKTTYWKEPTPDEIENFRYWRKHSFDHEIRNYERAQEGNALPINEIKKTCGETVASFLQDRYIKIIDCILKHQLTDEYYALATVAGKIDFLKMLHVEQLMGTGSIIPARHENETIADSHQNNRFSAKLFALYHSILIEMGKEPAFVKKQNGQFRKKDIIKLAEGKYPGTNAQGFYKAIANEIDMNKKGNFSSIFGTDYKKQIIAISKNDPQVTSYLTNIQD